MHLALDSNLREIQCHRVSQARNTTTDPQRLAKFTAMSCGGMHQRHAFLKPINPWEPVSNPPQLVPLSQLHSHRP